MLKNGHLVLFEQTNNIFAYHDDVDLSLLYFITKVNNYLDNPNKVKHYEASMAGGWDVTSITSRPT